MPRSKYSPLRTSTPIKVARIFYHCDWKWKPVNIQKQDTKTK